MPALQITKNEEHLCTVGSRGLFMFSAGVWGDLWSEEAAHLNVTGGTEEIEGKTEFLMWEFDHKLRNGDRVRFSFREGDTSSRPPETIRDKEKAWKDLPATDQPWPPPDDEIANFESRSITNVNLAWGFSMNGAAPTVYRPEGGRQQLSFSLLWNNRRPERIRVSLHSTSLREALARTGGKDYITEYVLLGSRFELQIGA
jgi:hypothetical protein